MALQKILQDVAWRRPPQRAWESLRSPWPLRAPRGGSFMMPIDGKDSASSIVVVKGHLADVDWKTSEKDEMELRNGNIWEATVDVFLLRSH